MPEPEKKDYYKEPVKDKYRSNYHDDSYRSPEPEEEYYEYKSKNDDKSNYQEHSESRPEYKRKSKPKYTENKEDYSKLDLEPYYEAIGKELGKYIDKKQPRQEYGQSVPTKPLIVFGPLVLKIQKLLMSKN